MTVAALRGAGALLRSLDPAAAANTADRVIICHTLSRLARGVSAAVAELQEHIYTPRRFGHRDARLADVEAAMYHAADLIEVTSENLADCATTTGRAMVRGDLVDYHGSLTAHRGVYRINGLCDCDRCDLDALSLELGNRVTGHAVLICVSPDHVTPIPVAVDPFLMAGAGTVEAALLAGFQALPTPIPPVDAVPLVRRLNTLTGRLADTIEAFASATATARQGWMLDVAYHTYRFGYARRYRHPRQAIQGILTQAPVTLAEARGRLRHAIGVLAELADQPCRERVVS